MKTNLIHDAEVVWEYLRLQEEAGSADVLLVLGSVDDRVAVYAAQLTKEWHYDTIVFSGGTAHTDDLLRATWPESEAEHFCNVFVKAGGHASRMLLETAAQNTGENATLSYELLRHSNIAIPRTMQIVTKPYMLRRARATFEKQWPDKRTRFQLSGPSYNFLDYEHDAAARDTVINIMVGDLQRIVEYPKRSLQVAQDVPDSVMKSWSNLVQDGYTKHVL